MQQFSQILFVMWRESVEAMLVIGILHAWLAHDDQRRHGLPYLWLGVLAGLVAALCLGLGLDALNDTLGDEGQDGLQAGLQLAAAALIAQMVWWMQRHGRSLRHDMEGTLDGHVQSGHWWGVSALAAIAVAREGSETVVFLGGMAAGRGWAQPGFWGALMLGLGLAWLTFHVLQWGGRVLSWRLFFRVTEALLLLLGGALLVAGVEKLVAMQALPALVNQVWNSADWLDDGTVGGGLVSAFTGYRSRPSLTVVLALAVYWLGMHALGRLHRARVVR